MRDGDRGLRIAIGRKLVFAQHRIHADRIGQTDGNCIK